MTTTTPQRARPVDAALEYAENGWPVFPCHSIHAGGCSCHRTHCSSPGKHPRIGGGLTAASTDHDTIRRWWRQWPTANVAIRTGAASGLVILDIDPDHGGTATFRLLVRQHGELLGGPTVRTGSGGAHLFFAHPGHRVRNSTGDLGPGVDIRGDGGYIIAPPSRHISGQTYIWETSGLELPAMPEWLLERTREPSRSAPSGREPIRIDQAIEAWARAALEDEAARVRSAPEGTRNNTLNRAAFCIGQIVGAGLLDTATAETTLIDTAISTGLTEHEARQTTRSGLRAGIERPRGPQRTPATPAPDAPAVDSAEIELDIPDTP
jgi:hypothetical protein